MSETQSNPNDAHECPYDGCSRTFDPDVGVKTHHFQAHGERLGSSEYTCERCGDTFRRSDSQAENARFCSKECSMEWFSEYVSENNQGEDNYFWNGGKVQVECDWCGGPYDCKPSHTDQSRFCSKKCYNKWMSENNSGENNPSWKGGRVHKVCEECSGEFKVKPNRKDSARFCSEECSMEWFSRYVSENQSGESNNFWNGGNVEVECEWCGELYESRPSHAARSRFCSKDCFGNWMSENNRGPNNPSWKGGAEEKQCEVCGSEFNVRPSREDTARFCSHDCRLTWFKDWASDQFAGEGNPAWKGGREPYGKGWDEEKKESVRERDGYECVYCGMSQEKHINEYGMKLHVHHITPAREIDDPEERNSKDNLETTCISCHRSVEKLYPLRPPQAAD